MAKIFLPRRANSVRELRDEFREKYAVFRAKRDHALARKQLTPRDRAILPILDGLEVGMASFCAANGPKRDRLVSHLVETYRLQRGVDPRFDYLHVTILDHAWCTSDETTIIDLPTIVQTASAILDQMAPDWTATIEMQPFANRKHASGGKLLPAHVHAIVRGHDHLTHARTRADHWNAQLRASIQGASAVDVRQIGGSWLDLVHVIRYPYKAVSRTKTAYINSKTKRANVHESEKGDRFIRYLRIFEILSVIEQRQLMFGGGAGIRVHEWALTQVEEQLAEESAARDRLMQLADVEAFWTDLMPRLGLKRFSMPRIIKRQMDAHSTAVGSIGAR